MRYAFVPTIIIVLAACGGGGQSDGDDASAAVESHRWTVPSYYIQAIEGIGDTPVWIADRVGEATGGSLELRVADAGKEIPGSEILQAVSNGEYPAGYASAGFWSGSMPAAPLFSAVPFGPDAPEYLAWLMHGGGMELYQRMYDDAGYHVKVLLAGMSAPETSGWFKEEITSVAQLEGKTMRIFGLGGDVMAELGVNKKQLGGSEVYEALDKGVVDCAEYSTPSVDAAKGFHQVAKYNYFPGWHQQATTFELLINKDAWNALVPSQRAALELACLASVTNSLAKMEAMQPAAMKRNAEEHGVRNQTWSDAMLAEFEGAWERVAAEQAKADPFFEEVYDHLQAFRADYRRWAAKGFLPRPEVED